MSNRTRAARAAVVLLLSPLAGGLWAAQFVAPGNGGDLYYAFRGSIYKIGAEPATLVVSVPTPVFPPRPGSAYELPQGAYYVSPYYLLSQPQLSRDGSILAFTGRRDCLGGILCQEFATRVPGGAYQTTVLGIPGKASLTFDGQCWLSGNGRYLLCDNNEKEAYFVDLETNQQYQLTMSDAESDTSRRRITDDGTAVIGVAPLYVSRLGQTLVTIGIGDGATIDAPGATVVYTSIDGLHIFRITQNQDILVVRNDPSCSACFAISAPSISAEGKRVLFLSNGAIQQLYAINADGTGLQDLTSSREPRGIKEYALSDDGQVAWYTSGDGSFVRLNLNTGQPIATFHPPLVDLAPVLVPGSAVNLEGQGLTDAPYFAQQTPLSTELGGVQVTLGGIAAPLVSVSPASIVFQVPWEVQAGQSVTVRVTTGAHSPRESSVQGAITPSSGRPVLLPSPASADFAAIHQDWSGFVTMNSPALVGETVYFYGTGFGPVQPQPSTGAPAPAAPLPFLSSSLACNAAVLYAGLAPGLVGYYQLTVRLPDSIPIQPVQVFYLQCGDDAEAAIPMRYP
jgi:uncharacterized protein (TIGR03437 family)